MKINKLHKRPYEDDDDEQERSKPAFIYKPCIGELVRTCYCPPGIVLLVAKIEEEPVAPPHDHRSALRLYLIDGEYMIQGIIKEETYPFITSGETVEGSYIMLDKYELGKLPKRNGKGDAAYLAIANFHTVGHCPDYSLKSIIDSQGASSSVGDIREKHIADEHDEMPPAKRFKPDSDESEKIDPIEDGDLRAEVIDDDYFDFDDIDENLTGTNPGVNAKIDSVKENVNRSGEFVTEKSYEDEIASNLGDTDEDFKTQSTYPEKEPDKSNSSTRLDSNKENVSPEGAEFTNRPTVNLTNGSFKDSSFTSISSSSSLSLSANVKPSLTKPAQPDEKPTMFKKAPVFMPSNPLSSKERITSTGHTLDFYEREIIEHYNQCHRRDFPIRRIFSMSDSGLNKLPTRELVDPSSPDTPLSQTAKMLLACHSLSQAALLAIERGKPLQRIPTLLDVICLDSLKNIFPKQNRVCDMIAIIDWVSPTTTEAHQIGLKREVRIVDDSTDKRVSLSVFDDPENFTPAVGTIALFRNVKNHKWDGYSLNAYKKDCTGWDWFIPNPDWVDENRVRRLREWWARTRVERNNRMGNVTQVIDRCEWDCKHGHDYYDVDLEHHMRMWQQEDEEEFGGL